MIGRVDAPLNRIADIDRACHTVVAVVWIDRRVHASHDRIAVVNRTGISIVAFNRHVDRREHTATIRTACVHRAGIAVGAIRVQDTLRRAGTPELRITTLRRAGVVVVAIHGGIELCIEASDLRITSIRGADVVVVASDRNIDIGVRAHVGLALVQRARITIVAICVYQAAEVCALRCKKLNAEILREMSLIHGD